MSVQTFQFDVPLAQEEVVLRLRAATRQKPSFVEAIKVSLESPYKKRNAFWGEVSEGSFLLTRRFEGRNSFVPDLRGSMTATPGGTHISVTVALRGSVDQFMLFVCAFSLLIAMALFAAGRATGDRYAFLIPLGMAVMSVIMSRYSYSAEVATAKELLFEVLHKNA